MTPPDLWKAAKVTACIVGAMAVLIGYMMASEWLPVWAFVLLSVAAMFVCVLAIIRLEDRP